MHLTRALKHLIVHMPNGFLNGMGWVGNGVSMRIASICKGRKNLIKMKNMHYFLKV